MLLDEIMGAYRNGEALGPDAVAELAEGLLAAHRTSTSACDILGFTQRRMQAYFYMVRDASLYRAWVDMPGTEDERVEAIARRLKWRDAAGFPDEMDELDRVIDYAQANGLTLPGSVNRVREIINTIDCELEDSNALADKLTKRNY